MLIRLVLLLDALLPCIYSGHCKAIFPKWDKAAEATKGIVALVKVDADKYGELSQKYGVSGFPTIKIFGIDKKKPQDYQGDLRACIWRVFCSKSCRLKYPWAQPSDGSALFGPS